MMKCLVTGGAGFIGSNLVDELIRDDHEVLIFDDLSTGLMENINPAANFIDADISDSSQLKERYLKEKMNGVEVVFHLAAKARVQPSIEDPALYNYVNVQGIVNMLKLSVDCGVKRFIFSSSSSVYGATDKLPSVEGDPKNPLSPYAAQKLIGEIYCKMFYEVYGLETVSLRYFNVYGERQPLEGAYALVMGIFAQQILDGKPMTINGDGEQRRDFTYVRDVVRANILAARSQNVGKGEVINIGNGDNRSVNQLADLIGGDRIYRDPVVEPRETLADNSLAKELLLWEPLVVLEDWMDGYKKDLGL
tara:strand:+ start:848 stop:1765 length:918 start_codon:yes stop_codon:yes gene_type:complete